jgi:hypothetical protein
VWRAEAALGRLPVDPADRVAAVRPICT